MSFFAKFFGRSFSVQTVPAPEEDLGPHLETTCAPLTDEASKQILIELLSRLETAGLRISPQLDRDLIIVRLLRSLKDFHPDDLAAYLAKAKENNTEISLDLEVFWLLASETDAFFDLDNSDISDPDVLKLSDDELRDLLDRHSFSIFENAASICFVNENAPGEYLQQLVSDLEALACGDFAVHAITEAADPGVLAGRLTLDDGRFQTLKLQEEKRPDVTPVLKAMNSLLSPSEKGRFVDLDQGSGDAFIAVYLRPGEQTAFRAWVEQQHCHSHLANVNWLD